MDGKSLDITEERRNKLKEILPDAFTEGKIDWEKLQATLGEDIEFKNERYVLNWAGKSDAFRVLQSPTTATLVPCKEESVSFDDTKNIFIEGENLEVLKVLQKSYFGKIKMIYIDPPYNTGNDKFIYPDKFSETRDEYLSRIGDKDETGYMTREGLFRKNSKDSGHYHSNWLSMMYPRLFLARNLLREDGVIFVSIDDNEVHNLRLLMNEVFGEDNFVAQFVWQKKYSRDNRPLIGTTHEYIVMYAINIEYFANVRNLLPPSEESLKVYKNPNNDPRGRWRPIPMTAQAGHATPSQFYEITTPTGVIHKPPVGRCWAITKKKYEQLLKEGRIYFGKGNSSQPNIIRYIDEIDGFVPWTWLPSSELGHTDSAMKEFYSIMGKEAAFETPKPSTLMKHFIKIASNNNDLILDFFAGTSTTAHAVLDLNKEDGASRKFIVVQLPEKCDESSDAYKAGYETIAEIGKERIRRVIKKIQDTEQQTKLDVDGATGKQDLGFKVFKLQQSNFKIWRSDVKTEEELYTQLTLHTDPVDENAKIENILYELLLKSGVPLTARIKKKDGYYLINKDEIALILKKIDESIIKAVISEKPKKFITLDRLFKNNDQLKTNTALQMKDVGIEFKAV
jgi:adenine-specific DNA-methyltransferase